MMIFKELKVNQFLNKYNSKFEKNNSPIAEGIVFLSILTILFFYLGFNNIFLCGPFGIHFMRQTDSLSFAANYFNNGFDFFNPELYNLKNIDGRAASEFPITYYITSLLYTIFGKQFYIQRLVHLTIAYFGAYAVFKLAKIILKDYWYALFISLTLFTSTVFNYYSFNYLPDVPALGFAFIGWYYIIKYRSIYHNKLLLFAFLFFTLSSLIKVTYLINPLTALWFAIIQLIFNKKENLFSDYKKVILYFSISVILVLIWNAYVFYYISKYNSTTFLTKVFPFWTLSKETIQVVWEHFSGYWYNKYLSRSVFHIIYILFAFQIIFYKKTNRQLTFLILLLFIGSICYVLLFFSQFKDHDYYFLTLFPLIFLLLINGINTFQKTIGSNYIHIIAKIIIATIVISGINLSKSKLEARFKKQADNYSNAGLVIENNSLAIKNLKLDKNAKIIVAPDYCQNGGLFFLDKKGWNLEPKDITIDNINNLKSKGADYFVVVENDSLFLSVAYSTGTMIFRKNELSIFKLKKP